MSRINLADRSPRVPRVSNSPSPIYRQDDRHERAYYQQPFQNRASRDRDRSNLPHPLHQAHPQYHERRQATVESISDYSYDVQHERIHKDYGEIAEESDSRFRTRVKDEETPPNYRPEIANTRERERRRRGIPGPFSGRHRYIAPNVITPGRPQPRKSCIPEGHDVTTDYFRNDRGMWDHDRLLNEIISEAQERIQESAAQWDREFLRQMLHDELASGDGLRAAGAAQNEPEMMHERFQSTHPPGDEHGNNESGPSRRREAGKSREEPEEECCEKLLRFLQRESEVHHRRWEETRAWQYAWMKRLMDVQKRASLLPVYPSPAGRYYGHGVPSPRAERNTHIYDRPISLGGARRPRPPSLRNIRVGLMFLSQGTAIQTNRLYEYPAEHNRTVMEDTWLIARMKSFYSKRVSSSRWLPPLRRLALAKFVRFEEIDNIQEVEWICTAQSWVLESIDDRSYDHFQYTIDFPLEGEKRWMRKLEKLVFAAPPDNQCVVWVYVFDRLNYWFLLKVIIIFVMFITTGGVVYAVLKRDVSSGLAISTYIIGFLLLMTAIWGVGEHMGVERPDSYSYSFDTVYGAAISDDAKVVAAVDDKNT